MDKNLYTYKKLYRNFTIDVYFRIKDRKGKAGF